MQKFKDSGGKCWEIQLPIGEVARIRKASEGQFNLWEPAKDDLADRLANDMPLFWELLWHLVEPQAEVASVSADDFGKAMAAECLYDAQKKFFEEWRDFFRRLARPDAEAIVEKIAQYRAKALELVKAKLATAELEKIDQRVETKMQRILNEQFGKLQESLDSILDPTPGDSSGACAAEPSATGGP